MDRNVTVAVLVVALLVLGGLAFGWSRAVSVAGPTAPVVKATPLPKPTPEPTPRVMLQNAHGVTSAMPAELPQDGPGATYLFDQSVLATRNMDDLVTFENESYLPGPMEPGGVPRNKEGYTVGQRKLLLNGDIVVIHETSKVNVLQVNGEMVQVRVLDGQEQGAVGWINKHRLLQRENGRFVAVYPVQLQ